MNSLFYQAENARTGDVIPKYIDGTYRLEIITRGSAACAYVNGEAAMSFRMYDLHGRNAGLFSFGRAEFTDFSIREQ